MILGGLFLTLFSAPHFGVQSARPVVNGCLTGIQSVRLLELVNGFLMFVQAEIYLAQPYVSTHTSRVFVKRPCEISQGLLVFVTIGGDYTQIILGRGEMGI